jgi:hypothetical protein
MKSLKFYLASLISSWKKSARKQKAVERVPYGLWCICVKNCHLKNRETSSAVQGIAHSATWRSRRESNIVTNTRKTLMMLRNHPKARCLMVSSKGNGWIWIKIKERQKHLLAVEFNGPIHFTRVDTSSGPHPGLDQTISWSIGFWRNKVGQLFGCHTMSLTKHRFGPS